LALVYIEYINRLSGVSLEQFHFAASLQDSWSEEHGEDVLVLNMGRTFRTGPEHARYVAAWYTPDAGLDRIGVWEGIFERGEADQLEETFKLGAQIDAAGCYEPLLDPVQRRGGLYLAEFVDFAPGATRDDVRTFYEGRRERSGVELNLLCDRIGTLGPDPARARRLERRRVGGARRRGAGARPDRLAGAPGWRRALPRPRPGDALASREGVVRSAPRPGARDHEEEPWLAGTRSSSGSRPPSRATGASSCPVARR
jgi:hypothetical protein